MARGRNSNRGGYRQPENPAPVSNPGSGARTDGGPGNARQPIRVAPGQPYGQRQNMENQQRAAPLAVGGQPSPGGPGGGQPAAVGPPPVGPDGIFGPSTQGGAPTHMQMPPPGDVLDADTVLRLLYQKRPSPWIARLLDDGR